jgi:hypothetical protein
MLAVTACVAAPRQAEFLWVSDIHFNPMADAALADELVKAEPAEWEAILNRTSPAGFSQYKSDTNWWLLKSALRQMPKTIRHPAFVMVTGDLLAHDFPQLYQAATHDDDQQHYRAFVKKTVRFLAWELRTRFPSTPIYLTPGNNDNDCGDYTIQAGGAFLDDTAAIAREAADGDDGFTKSWKALGSFNVAHPTLANVRVLSLNSIFWSQKYQALSSEDGCKAVPSTAGADLMTWLEQQLQDATRAHEKVWLMFHIPPGIDGYASAVKRKKLEASVEQGSSLKDPSGQNQAEWGTRFQDGYRKTPAQAAKGRPLEWGTRQPKTDQATCAQSIVPMWKVEWTARFDALVEKYSGTVGAVFAAHTHSDDFRLIGAAGGRRRFVVMSPAISPIYQQNPSFRTVKYRADGMLLDHSTYFLTNLPAATSTTKGRWKREYSYARLWKAKAVDAASLSSVYEQVVKDDKGRAEWLKLYAVSGPALEGEKPIVLPLYCAVEGLTVENYRRCWCGASQ